MQSSNHRTKSQLRPYSATEGGQVAQDRRMIIVNEITFEELVADATEAYNNARGPLPACRVEAAVEAIMDKIGKHAILRVYTGNGDFEQYRIWKIDDVVVFVDKCEVQPCSSSE